MAEGRSWRRHVRRDARVSSLVVSIEQQTECVERRSRVVEETTDGATDYIVVLAREYIGVYYLPKFPGEPRVNFNIGVETSTHANFVEAILDVPAYTEV